MLEHAMMRLSPGAYSSTHHETHVIASPSSKPPRRTSDAGRRSASSAVPAPRTPIICRGESTQDGVHMFGRNGLGGRLLAPRLFAPRRPGLSSRPAGRLLPNATGRAQAQAWPTILPAVCVCVETTHAGFTRAFPTPAGESAWPARQGASSGTCVPQAKASGRPRAQLRTTCSRCWAMKPPWP